jgi:hypothetical protein
MLGDVSRMTQAHWVATIAGLAFVAGGVALGSGPYHDRRAFEKAGYCSASTAHDDCIARMRMTVLSKSSYTTEDPDPNWPPPQPPQPPPQPPPIPGPFGIAPALGVRLVAALPMSETTHYKLTVRTEDGRRHTFNVGPGIYDAAKAGTTGVAEVWHGHIKRLRIGAQSDDEWSYWTLGVGWILAWGGVMLLIGWGLPLDDVPVGVVIGGWWLAAIVFAITNTWDPAIWVVPGIVAGGVLLLRVSATVGTTRRRARRPYRPY